MEQAFFFIISYFVYQTQGLSLWNFKFKKDQEKEIDKVVEETALSLYLNFIGMIFVADFMKFVVKLLAETPKKRVS